MYELWKHEWVQLNHKIGDLTKPARVRRAFTIDKGCLGS
jgi:hypothetical protein